MVNSAIQVILTNCLQIAITVIFGVVAKCIIPAIVTYIKESTNSALIESAMTELEGTAQSVVGYIEQSMVKQLKADGQWCPETQKQVLSDAADMLIDQLSLKTTEVVEKNGIEIEDIAVRYIESKIAESKVR